VFSLTCGICILRGKKGYKCKRRTSWEESQQKGGAGEGMQRKNCEKVCRG
jgi:hypothetical protein